ncbi:hypothetical protein LF296_01475 [Acinetobacter vivianii]|uniref:Uncharacterized protein n=1 Tax=Acinetobacter vivianii TaxID=1776742 RepID=A0AAJ6P5K6_9GAMM|nr:hypothetical protein [Acinetobacter vivianii]WDZ51501.1 hypothetical protein LF296_01475 [Acinetobacter vivianii]
MNLKLLQLNGLKSLWGNEVDRLIDSITSFTVTQTNKLERKYKELQRSTELSDDHAFHIEESIIDEAYELNEIEELAYELAIIALYKKIEITTKKNLKITYPEIDRKKLYKFKKLKKILKDKEIDIESFSNYLAMDELRCLNNSIKHSGEVDSELAKYAGWNENERVDNLQEAYKRLAPKCNDYIKELLDQFIAQQKELVKIG